MWELRKNLCCWIAQADFLVPGGSYITLCFSACRALLGACLSLCGGVGPVSRGKGLCSGTRSKARAPWVPPRSGLSIRKKKKADEQLLGSSCRLMEGGTRGQTHSLSALAPVPASRLEKRRGPPRGSLWIPLGLTYDRGAPK